VDSVIHILNNWEQLIAHFVPCNRVVHGPIIQFPELSTQKIPVGRYVLINNIKIRTVVKSSQSSQHLFKHKFVSYLHGLPNSRVKWKILPVGTGTRHA